MYLITAKGEEAKTPRCIKNINVECKQDVNKCLKQGVRWIALAYHVQTLASIQSIGEEVLSVCSPYILDVY